MDEQIGKMQQDMDIKPVCAWRLPSKTALYLWTFSRLKRRGRKKKQNRFLLETRLQVLEQKENLKSAPGHEMEEVDKSIAVVGGFGDKTVEEAEELLR